MKYLLIITTLTIANIAYATLSSSSDNTLNILELNQTENKSSIQNTSKTLLDYFNFDKLLMYSILTNTTPFNNEFYILDAKSHLNTQTIYIGGYAQGGANIMYANKSTYFYSTGQTFQSKNNLSLDRTALAIIANLNTWASVYLETGITNIGETYTSNLKLNQYYLLLGNGSFPLYGFAGYKNIDFGNFSTVNIFAQPVTRWDYAGSALTAGTGFRYNGFNTTLSALRSGTQGAEDYYGSGLWRVYNYPNYYTKGGTNNFAINTSYSARTSYFDWAIGGGYMRGLWLGNPANYFNDATIGAWDINAQMHTEHTTLLAEFVTSTPNTTSFGSFTPQLPGGAKLKTWDIGTSYSWNDFILPHASVISLDDSGIVGNNSFAQVSQLVFGIKNHAYKYLWPGIEYVLINQSSDQDAMRSGLFYRAHNTVQALRLNITANF